MNLNLVLAFWGVALLLIVVPGPDWAFVLASGLRDRRVAPAVGGLMIGYLLLTALVAAGVGAIVTERPAVLTVLTVVGAGYLIFLGVGQLASRPAAAGADPAAGDPTGEDPAPPSRRSARLVRGIGVSALNPKGLLVFLAMLPQFTQQAGGWPLAGQIGVLGMVFVVSCGAFYALLGTGTRWMMRARPGLAAAVSRVSAAAMVLVGVALFVERVIQIG